MPAVSSATGALRAEPTGRGRGPGSGSGRRRRGYTPRVGARDVGVAPEHGRWKTTIHAAVAALLGPRATSSLPTPMERAFPRNLTDRYPARIARPILALAGSETAWGSYPVGRLGRSSAHARTAGPAVVRGATGRSRWSV